MSMGNKCFNCKKGIMYGHNVSHAKNRTRRIFKPNLHSVKILVDGSMKRVRLCTKCLRKLKIVRSTSSGLESSKVKIIDQNSKLELTVAPVVAA